MACYLFVLFVGGFYFTYRLRKRLNDMSANKKRGSTNPKLAKKAKDLTYFMALETFVLFCTTVVSGTNVLLRHLGLVSNETTPKVALAIKARPRVGGAPPRRSMPHHCAPPRRSSMHYCFCTVAMESSCDVGTLITGPTAHTRPPSCCARPPRMLCFQY